MAKYIIFLDGEMKGYLNDELSVKRAISDLADTLIENFKKKLPDHSRTMTRVFRENVDYGIKLYSQEVGNYFNGYVSLIHQLSWCVIFEYNPDNILNTEILLKSE